MAADASEDDKAHFLRRLSIADARDLLQKKVKEKEKRIKEMHAIIGVRYQDLIESADKIIQMHSTSIRLAESLHQLPSEWSSMEAALLKILFSPDDLEGGDEDLQQRPGMDDEEAMVCFLTDSPEKMWQLLDTADTLEATKVFFEAERLFHSEEIQSQLTRFTFLERTWSCIALFRERIVSYAHEFLKCKGRDSIFYGSQLASIVILDPKMNMKDLIVLFLESYHLNSLIRADEALQLFLQATTYVHEIWFGNSAFSQVFEYRPEQEQELLALKASKELQQHLTAWVDSASAKIRSMALHSIEKCSSLSAMVEFVAEAFVLLRRYWTKQNDLSLSWVAETNTGLNFTSPELFFKSMFDELLTSQVQAIVRESFMNTNTLTTTTVHSFESNLTGNPSAEIALEFTTLLKDTYDKLLGFSPLDFTQMLKEEVCLALFRLTVHMEKTVSNHHDPNPFFFVQLGHNCYHLSNGLLHHQFIFEECDSGEDRNKAAGSDPSAGKYRAVFDSYARDETLRKDHILQALKGLHMNSEDCCHLLDTIDLDRGIGWDSFNLLVTTQSGLPSRIKSAASILQRIGRRYCEQWAMAFIKRHISGLDDRLQNESYDLTNEEWIETHDGWIEHTIHTELDSGSDQECSPKEKQLNDVKTDAFFDEKFWLSWTETPHVSSFLFKCCSALDQAYQLVHSDGSSTGPIDEMTETIHAIFAEQVTIAIVQVYEAAISKLEEARKQASSLNFGESCVLQLLFDMYFIRASLGYSDFTRFEWGDVLRDVDGTSELLQLRRIVARMHTFVDPVDWELLGPQLIENVVCRYRTSRMLLYSLSNGNDISEIEGKPVINDIQDLRPMVRIAEPVSRLSLLPRQYSSKALMDTPQRKQSETVKRVENDASSSPVASTLTSILNTSQMAQIF